MNPPFLSRICAIIGLVLLAGCAAPTIDASKLNAPKSVVIADFPDINPAATIQIINNKLPNDYFGPAFDSYFVLNGVTSDLPTIPDNSQQINQTITNQIINSPRPLTPGQAGLAGGLGGLFGAWVQQSAEETQKKAREFPGLIKKAAPNMDLHGDLMTALRSGLEAKKISVTIDSATRNQVPRLRWPAKDAKGEPLPVGPLADSPAVDADLLVQVSAIAVYAAPGPLNSYSRRVGIAIALFNGRTREFIGWQAVPFNDPISFSYSRYNSLSEDVDRAGPALQKALMSVVPEAVRIISAGNP